MAVKEWIEVAMLGLMGAGLLGFFANRFHLKKGIGLRSIQFIAVVFVLPMTVVLNLEDKLGSEATATIFGTVVGYVLQSIAKEEE